MSPDTPSPSPTDAPPGAFATTCWTTVLRAVNESGTIAEEPLTQLYNRYQRPLYAYLRRRGLPAHDAEDAIHSFFHQVIDRRSLANVDRQAGRFRNYMLTALNNFLAKEHRKAVAQKRGGGATHVEWTPLTVEQKQRWEPNPALSAEANFDRAWASAVMMAAMDQVVASMESSGATENEIAVLKQFLPGARQTIEYAEAAAQLDIPVGTLKARAHRAKSRLKEALRREVAETVDSESEVESELKHLIDVLSAS